MQYHSIRRHKMGNYTKSIQSGFYDMIEKDITDIWSELNINTAAITS